VTDEQKRFNPPKCPKCGFVMCEQFDEKQERDLTMMIPNGKYVCYHCEDSTAPNLSKEKP